MKFEVKLSDDETFVWQLPKENITIALADVMSRQAIQLAATKNINKHLSDCRGIRNIEGVLKKYEFAHIDLGQIGYRRSDKIAVVHDEDDHSHDFIETVSRNAGYTVRLFTEVRAAIDWLLGDLKPRRSHPQK